MESRTAPPNHAHRAHAPHDHVSPPMALDGNAFRAAGHALVDRIADFLDGVGDARITPGLVPRGVRAMLPQGGMPAQGADPSALLQEAASLLFRASTLNASPRFFGYIIGCPSPAGALAEMLAATVNPNVGAWALSPAATEIEAQSIRWLAELVGFPRDCGGLLVSGGNMANMVCFFAALRAAVPWDVRTHGIAPGAAERNASDDATRGAAHETRTESPHHAPRPVVYASEETHTWVQKAADLSGIGLDAIRWIATDASYRMDVAALRQAIARDRAEGAGVLPAMVIGTAGSVSTGAIDPLREIAALCRAEKLWLHVDGAYGAPAAMLPDAPEDLKALALGDSLALDPHKWLYAPLEAGCALVRDAEALHGAYAFHPPYYRFEEVDGEPPLNYHEWGPQNSRGFRALKVWLGLRQAGRRGYERMIAHDIAIARALHQAVAAHGELQPLTQSLSITTFRYVPPALRQDAEQGGAHAELDALNAELLARLQDAGRVFLSNAVLDGRFALRACVVNFRTRAEDVPVVVDEVVRLGRELASAPTP
ncbi:MAG TPA: aminotransferase class V-fold PLP-dependent enzyme [Gemmatimonadaceae bacterium]|nr:aminotransferase class V-fold PLP-dependent enzyme [Gemmatimonadaceae bacterium]